MNIFQRIYAAWRRVRRKKSLEEAIQVDSMADLPNHVKPGMLYLVGGATPKWAVLGCPCRCGERIDVNLMHRRQPVWTLTKRGEAVTLYPSVWMPDEKCGSHFWVRDGSIIWV